MKTAKYSIVSSNTSRRTWDMVLFVGDIKIQASAILKCQRDFYGSSALNEARGMKSSMNNCARLQAEEESSEKPFTPTGDKVNRVHSVKYLGSS